MILTHSKKCECGKEFDTFGNLIPNVKDKEFYGGRISFFKEVTCDCGKEYILLIEKYFDHKEGMAMRIIDMIDMTDETSYPINTIQKKVKPKEKELEDRIDTVEHTLTKVLTRETQVEALKTRTQKELQDLCREHKIKFKITESKLTLIDKLLDAIPDLVVAR